MPSAGFIGGALAVAMHIQDPSIERDHAAIERGLAETRARGHRIDDMASNRECGNNMVEIPVSPAPEMKARNRPGGNKGMSFSGSKDGIRSGHRRNRLVGLRVLDAYGI